LELNEEAKDQNERIDLNFKRQWLAIEHESIKSRWKTKYNIGTLHIEYSSHDMT